MKSTIFRKLNILLKTTVSEHNLLALQPSQEGTAIVNKWILIVKLAKQYRK